MPDFSISFSWATLARKYPLSGDRSVPTMESATWCRTSAVASAARRLRPEVSKNSNTALSSHEGAFAKSTTTRAPASAFANPSPVMVLTPVLGEAATTSWPPWRRMATVFEPIRPVPPMTTIFICPLLSVVARNRSSVQVHLLLGFYFIYARRKSAVPPDLLSLHWHERRSALVLDQEHQEFCWLGFARVPIND